MGFPIIDPFRPEYITKTFTQVYENYESFKSDYDDMLEFGNKLVEIEYVDADGKYSLLVKGNLTDEQYNIYYWELTEETGISVTYYSGTKGNIKVDIDKKLLKNSKVDFSKYEELRTKINDGITYEEFVTYVGGVEGTLVEKGSITNKYIWVDEDDSYLNASFSSSSNKCTFISGMIY